MLKLSIQFAIAQSAEPGVPGSSIEVTFDNNYDTHHIDSCYVSPQVTNNWATFTVTFAAVQYVKILSRADDVIAG